MMLAAARDRSRERRSPEGMGHLFDLGSLRVRALYSQGGVEIEPSTIPRTTSWILDKNNPEFSTLDMDSKYASAPPVLGGQVRHNSPQKVKGDYQLVPPEPETLCDTETDGLTQNQVVVYLVTAIIGCGVVVLPSLMAIGGWVVVPVIAGVVTLAFMEIGRVMDTALACADSKTKTQAKSFEDLGRAAMDTLGVTLIRTVTGTGFIGTLVVYAMLIGQNIHGLLGKRFSMNFVMVLVTPLLTILALLKDSTLANIMSIGMLASLGSCVLICIKGFLDARIWQAWPEEEHVHVHRIWPDDCAALGTVLAVMFSAFSVMGTVPCIRGQMKDPTEFLPAFQTSLVIVLGMYLAVMFLGYWGYGNYVQHNVVNSMMYPPRTLDEALSFQGLEEHDMIQNPIGIIMAVLVTTYLFLGFSLFFKCIAGMVRNLLGKSQLYKEGTVANQMLRTFMVVAIVAVGLAVPHFLDVMAIMSSVCCSCNNVFFPLAFAFKLEMFGDSEAGMKSPYRVTRCRRIGLTCIMILGIFCFSLGLWSSLSNLAREMGNVPELADVTRKNASALVSPLAATTFPARGVPGSAQSALRAVTAVPAAAALSLRAAPAATAAPPLPSAVPSAVAAVMATASPAPVLQRAFLTTTLVPVATLNVAPQRLSYLPPTLMPS